MADHDGNRQSATPQEVWNILRELSESQKETDRRMQETDRRMQETDRRMQETDQLLKRQAQETDQLLKRRAQETDRRIRKLDDLFTGQWGKLMEALVEGDLIELLKRRGIEVERTVTNLKQRGGARQWEIDILAVNGAEVVVVEVKTTLKVRHVDHLLELLRDFPELAPEYGSRRIYGAVAYLKADESSDSYAEGRGLYVIRATGSSASITNRKDFRPRTFGRRTVAAC